MAFFFCSLVRFTCTKGFLGSSKCLQLHGVINGRNKMNCTKERKLPVWCVRFTIAGHCHVCGFDVLEWDRAEICSFFFSRTFASNELFSSEFHSFENGFFFACVSYSPRRTLVANILLCSLENQLVEVHYRA